MINILKENLILELVYIKELIEKGDKENALDNIIIIIDSLRKNNVVNNKYRNKFIRKKSQAGQILEYMQKNPNKEFTGSDFMKNSFFTKIPFIGYSASARLSELKRFGLVEIVGKVEGIKKFFYKSKDRNLYRITEKGLVYNLR